MSLYFAITHSTAGVTRTGAGHVCERGRAAGLPSLGGCMHLQGLGSSLVTLLPTGSSPELQAPNLVSSHLHHTRVGPGVGDKDTGTSLPCPHAHAVLGQKPHLDVDVGMSVPKSCAVGQSSCLQAEQPQEHSHGSEATLLPSCGRAQGEPPAGGWVEDTEVQVWAAHL